MRVQITHQYENTLDTEISDDLSPEEQKDEAKRLADEMEVSDSSWICATFVKILDDESEEEWFDLP